MSPGDPRHGTYAGYQQDRRDGARSRAMWRLAQMHRDDFDRLIEHFLREGDTQEATP